MIQKELTHVRNAIQTLDERREEFPRGTVIGDPEYWRARLHSIRGRAERYNHQKLVDQVDDLLVKVSKLPR